MQNTRRFVASPTTLTGDGLATGAAILLVFAADDPNSVANARLQRLTHPLEHRAS
jgi:hypothetical protein